ncbi:MAG: hypothetical protein ACI7YS_17800 [Flavobacterium sp.]
MKNIVVLIVFILFMKPVLPVLEYALNYDYIANVLCENKEKKEMKCNGKCHLMKELAKASENEKPISSDKKDNTKHEIEVLFFLEPSITEVNQFLSSTNFKINHNYSNFYSFLNGCSEFHPPAV